MTKNIILFLIYSLIAIISIIIIAVFYRRNQKYYLLIENNSEQIKELKNLNKEIKFNDNLQTQYYFSTTCNSKRQLEQLNLRTYLITLIERNKDYFTNIYNTIMLNIINYDIYTKRLENIKSTITSETCINLKTKINKFKKYEARLFKKLIISPITDLNMRLRATYTSPAGRNKYSKENCYNFNQFQKVYLYTIELIDKKQTRQYQIQLERAKLTDSLRYDVLRRDDFRCQICGSTASDGVKLHIDHIIPVSKGGRTVMENLRTLCDRCNLGKKDKIE